MRQVVMKAEGGELQRWAGRCRRHLGKVGREPGGDEVEGALVKQAAVAQDARVALLFVSGVFELPLERAGA